MTPRRLISIRSDTTKLASAFALEGPRPRGPGLPPDAGDGVPPKMPLALPRGFFILVLVCFSGLAELPAKEVDYASRPARGLAIYKKHDFASDNTATLLEYRTFIAHDRVSYLITTDGNRITIPARGTSLLLIPYPGKGEATPQQALAVIEFAGSRFPQYRRHLIPLQAAWKKEAHRPASEIQEEIATRDKNKQTGLAFMEWLKSLSPDLPPLKIPPSLLDGDRPGQASEIAVPAETEPTETETNAEPDPQDFKANLKHIQDAYKAINDLEAE